MSLLNSYKLRKRLEKLESLVYERSVGRGGAPSNAMQVWQLLMDNGPMTRQQIQSQGLSATATANASLNFYATHGLLVRNGDTFSANPDYAWDDVGVIPRTAQQEQIIDTMNNNTQDDTPVENEPPVQTRAPRTRRRAIKANIFSKKVEEVQAAIDEGVDVNTTDSKGRTPLIIASMARNGDTGAVIRLLLDNGANPNDDYNAKSAVYYTVMYNNKEGTLALAHAGADLAITGRRVELMVAIIESGLFNTNEIISMITENFIKSYVGRHYYIGSLLDKGLSKLDNPELFVNTLVSTTLKVVSNKFEILRSGLSAGVTSPNWFIVADALERNGYAIYFNGSYTTIKIAENRDVANKVYELAEKIGDGTIKVFNLQEYCEAVIRICNKYKKPLDVLENMMTQSVFDNLDSSQQWDMLSLVMVKNIPSRDTLISRLSKLKFKRPAYSEVIKDVIYDYEYGDTNDSVKRLVCRKVRPYINLMDDSTIYHIANMFDREFIDEMIDAGLGEALASVSPNISVACRQALEQEGLLDDNQRSAVSSRTSLIRKITQHIYNDTMDQNTRRQINENPEILSNERIQDALNNPSNEDSITATQLKRQYDQWVASSEKPKYDM